MPTPPLRDMEAPLVEVERAVSPGEPERRLLTGGLHICFLPRVIGHRAAVAHSRDTRDMLPGTKRTPRR